MEFEFTLVKSAKGEGGDRYVCDTDEKFTIYVPQEVSRSSGASASGSGGSSGASAKKLKVKIEVVGE